MKRYTIRFYLKDGRTVTIKNLEYNAITEFSFGKVKDSVDAYDINLYKSRCIIPAGSFNAILLSEQMNIFKRFWLWIR